MAKQCAVCHKSYPDDQASCPHCGAPAGGHESVELGGPRAGPSDSAIDLGQPPSGSSSGSSSDIAWAALSDEPEHGGSGSPGGPPAGGHGDMPEDSVLVTLTDRSRLGLDDLDTGEEEGLVAELAEGAEGPPPHQAPPAPTPAAPAVEATAQRPAPEATARRKAEETAVRGPEGPPPTPAPSDSGIDLGRPGAHPAAGAGEPSGVAWAAPPAPGGTGEPAPADIDILSEISGVDIGHAVPQDAAPPPEPAPVEEVRRPASHGDFPEDSVLVTLTDRGRLGLDDLERPEDEGLVAEPAEEEKPAPQEVRPPREAGSEIEPTQTTLTDRALLDQDLDEAAEEELVAELMDDSGVRLDRSTEAEAGHRPGRDEEAAQEELAAEILEESDSGLRVREGAPGTEDSGSAIDLDAIEPASSDSGRDLIAEAVESGVDLDKHAAGEEHVDLDELSTAEDSSAVDLGAHATELAAREERARTGEAASYPEEGSLEGAAPESSGIDLEERTPSTLQASPSDILLDESSVRQRPGLAPPSAEEILIDTSSVRQRPEEIEEALRDEGAAPPPPHLPPEEEEAEPTPFTEELVEPEPPEEEEEPRRPVPVPHAEQPRSRAGAWAGGTVLGAVLGAGACFAGLLVSPPDVREKLGLTGVKATASASEQQPGAKPRLTFQDLINQGEWGKAESGGVQEPEQSTPQQLEARGEYRWLSYLQQHRQTGQKLNANDPEVKQAVQDLTEAKTADAVFWLGHIEEQTGQLDKARKTYEQGMAQFKEDPDQVQRFQAALYRLDLDETGAPAAGAGAWRGRPEVGALAVLLVALQQPEGGAPGAAPPGAPPGGAAPPRAANEEAGFSFWSALRLARAGNYDEAIKILKRARDLHNVRRFTTRFRKTQNPFSDPDEDIFLRSCDQIEAYWKLRAQLQNTASQLQLADRKDPAKVVQELTARAQKGAGGGAGDAVVKSLADKLKTKPQPQDLDKAIDQLVAERQSAQDEVKKARQDAEDQRARVDAANDRVKELEQKLAAMPKEPRPGQGNQTAEINRLKNEVARWQKEAENLRKNPPAREQGNQADEINRLRAAADAAQKKAEQEIAAVKQKAQDQIAAAQKKADDQVAAIRKDADRRVAEARKKGTAEPADVARLRAELENAQKEAEEKIAAVQKKAQEDIATVRKQADEQVAAAQEKAQAAQEKAQAAQAEISRLQTEVADIRKTAQDDVAKARAAAAAAAAQKNPNQQDTGTRPEAATGFNPLEADRHYAAGLNLYFERRYEAAEREFQAALDNDNRDARFYYFLGLSRLAQGKADAYGDFDRGAQLEKRGMPPRAAVSTSLERVQGPVRQTLDSARDRSR